jgi:hypothetical protein
MWLAEKYGICLSSLELVQRLQPAGTEEMQMALHSAMACISFRE